MQSTERGQFALFAGDGYDELVTASTSLLDETCTRRDRVATSDAFDRSTRYELAFWQMAYLRGER
jgi:thiaminase